MKTTYKTIFGFCVIIAVGLLSSCNDWLDVSPDTEVDKKTLLNNESGFADAMSGIYVNMTSNSLYGKNLSWCMLELMGGGAYANSGDNASLQGFYFQPKNEKYKETLRNAYVDPIWNGEYNTIANINSLLESIDEKKDVFTGNDYNVFKGELLGLRAFLHFDLLRLFADAFTSANYSETKTYIPYLNDLTSNVHPLLTNKQVCELLLKDLKEAKELLKSDPMYKGETPSEYVCSAPSGNESNRTKYGITVWHNRRFHFNYYAVVATMARLYLWMGDKADAKDCALEIINMQREKFPWVNAQLVTNTQSSSDALPRDRTFCTEQIFALNVMDLPDKTDGYLWEGQQTFSNSNTNILGFDPDIFDATSQQNDIRYGYLKSTYKVGANEFLLSSKYKQDADASNNNSPWARNRLALIRLAEMYYIAAECEDYLPVAVGYLNTVRAHRGLEATPLKINSREELEEQIRLEYHKEMIAEGQTFYYYKRLNKDIKNKSVLNGSVIITPDQFTLPRPDNEDTWGGRNNNK